LLGLDQRQCIIPEARSEGKKLHRGKSEGILACLGPDQREDILPEARSEGMKLHRGRSEGIYTSCSQMRGYEASQTEDQREFWLVREQITEKIHSLKTDQSVRSFIGWGDQRVYIPPAARSEFMKLHREKVRGDIGLSGNRSERINSSLSQIRRYEASWGQIRGNIYFLKPDQREQRFILGRSEGLYTSSSQIRGEMGTCGPDQTVGSHLRARCKGT
jgi:hypothetical protein